eukprot:TCONS_00011826-protein
MSMKHSRSPDPLDDTPYLIPPPDDEARKCGCKNETFRLAIGLVLVFMIAISWTGATQFGRSVYDVNFDAPYLTAWFVMCFQCVIFPLSLLAFVGRRKKLREYWNKSMELFGPDGLTLRGFLKFGLIYALPLNIISILANYLFYRALKSLNPSTVASIFSAQSAFVYALSIIFLKEKFFFTRLTSVLLSVGGIVLMGHGEGFQNASTVGVILTAIAALCAAIFQVAFKRSFGFPATGQVAVIVTYIGLTNLVVLPYFIFIFKHVGWEHFIWSALPWKLLIGTALLGLMFNFLLIFGVAYTYPLFISIGNLIGVPMNAAIDAIFRGEDFDAFKIAAFFIIVTGFMLLLIPISRIEYFEREVCCKKCSKRNDEEDLE